MSRRQRAVGGFIWNSHSKSEITRSLDRRRRTVLARELDDELGEDVHLDVRHLLRRKRLAVERDALLDGEHRSLVRGIANDADDDAVRDLQPHGG